MSAIQTPIGLAVKYQLEASKLQALLQDKSTRFSLLSKCTEDLNTLKTNVNKLRQQIAPLDFQENDLTKTTSLSEEQVFVITTLENALNVMQKVAEKIEKYKPAASSSTSSKTPASPLRKLRFPKPVEDELKDTVAQRHDRTTSSVFGQGNKTAAKKLDLEKQDEQIVVAEFEEQELYLEDQEFCNAMKKVREQLQAALSPKDFQKLSDICSENTHSNFAARNTHVLFAYSQFLASKIREGQTALS